LRCCSLLWSAHRDNEMNDERHKKDVLLSAILQKRCSTCPWVSYWTASLRALPSAVLGLRVSNAPQVDPVPPTVVSERDEGTASWQ
jgi:hypothetical protein